MTDRQFTRAPRVAARRFPSDGFFLVRALAKDPRFIVLTSSHRDALMRAAIEYADAEGRFWPKVATWATLCRTSPKTIERAIRSADAVGLLRREPYLRPDGRQGSTTYIFDQDLLPRRAPGLDESGRSVATRGGTHGGPCPASDEETPRITNDAQASALTADEATGPVTDGRAEQKVEQESKQKEGLVLEPLARPAGRAIVDDCPVCKRRTRHIDDGRECVCIECPPRSAGLHIDDGSESPSERVEIPF